MGFTPMFIWTLSQYIFGHSTYWRRVLDWATSQVRQPKSHEGLSFRAFFHFPSKLLSFAFRNQTRSFVSLLLIELSSLCRRQKVWEPTKAVLSWYKQWVVSTLAVVKMRTGPRNLQSARIPSHRSFGTSRILRRQEGWLEVYSALEATLKQLY